MSVNLRIETSRLLIRDFVTEDWSAVHRYAGDPRAVKFMIWGPNSEQESATFLNRTIANQSAHPRQHYDAGITIKPKGEVVGACSLSIRVPPLLEVELGYIVNPDFWGRGIATEAGRGMIGFAFQKLRLHRVYATCDTENVASVRVLEKLGMHREGHLREYRRIRDGWRDHYLYAVLRREWSD